MKYGIVSDTHSNYHALKAVLDHMDSIGVDKKVHLGDIVGYGPKPKETLSLTLERFNYITKGHHDLALVNEVEGWGFTPQARYAIDWTRDVMSSAEIDIVRHINFKHNVGDIMFTHSKIESADDAREAFLFDTFKIAFLGGTHVPFVWRQDEAIKPHPPRVSGASEFGVEVSPLGRTIINVGAVGQPRDGDPRASYVIYDTETGVVTFYKVPYSVDRTVGLMQRAGFSNNACERLLFGR